MMRPFFAFIIFIFISILGSYAQKDSFAFEHYNSENGLPQNSVVDIGIDNSGFAWLSTESGLVRFDGQQFRNFNLSNCAQLKNTDRMRAIFVDDSSRLFVTNSFFDLYKIADLNTIVPITTNNGITPETQALTVQGKLIELKKFEKGYGILDDHRYQSDSTRERKRALFQREAFYSISSNEIYVLTFKDVYYLNSNGGKKIVTPYLLEHTFFLNDTLIVTGKNGCFSAFYKNDDFFTSLRVTGDILSNKLYTADFSNLKIFGKKQHIILKMGSSLYTITRDGNNLMTCLISDIPGIKNIRCITYDSLNDQYFIGTESEGLFVAKHRNFRNILQPETLNPKLPQNIFTQQMLLSNDRIITENHTMFNKYGIASFNNIGNFSSVYKDIDGGFWFVLDQNIIKISNTGIKELEIFQTHEYPVRFFVQDPQSGQMYCAFSPQLIRRINQVEKSLEPLPFSINIPEQEKIACLQPNGAGGFWVATNNGLYELGIHPYSLKKVKNSDNKIIRWLLNDTENGITWAATYGQGPGYVKNNVFYPLPLDKAHNLLTAHCFIEDSNGFFWMPTNHGLLQVLKKDWLSYIAGHQNEYIYYQYYKHSDGFASNEFNGGTSMPFIRRSDGLVSLPTMNGLVWFYPKNISPKLPNAPIYIDDIKIDNRDTAAMGNLVLKNDFNQLSVSIVSPYFGNSENIYLEFQLQGISNTWEMLPADRHIRLSRLPHGKYTLNIRSHSGFGSQYKYATLQLVVLPTWHQTPWFYAALGLLIVFGVWMLVRQRFKQLLRRKDFLKQQVAERTASLHEMVDNLKNTNQQLSVAQRHLLKNDKAKEDIIGLILHDLWSPLNTMATSASRINRLRDKYSKDELMEFVVSVNETTTGVVHLSDHLLKWLRSQEGSFLVKKEWVVLTDILLEIVNLYKAVAAQRGNVIAIECPADTILQTDPNAITIIIRNLVDNANKNTTNGRIVINCNATGTYGEQQITIIDSGRGMTDETIDKIMQLKENFGTKTGSLGFKFVFEFASMIGAQIEIDRGRAFGSAVSIKLPGSSIA